MIGITKVETLKKHMLHSSSRNASNLIRRSDYKIVPCAASCAAQVLLASKRAPRILDRGRDGPCASNAQLQDKMHQIENE